MRRGDRVELLKRLADRLGADDYSWEDRRLVLYQFGFRGASPDEWEGSARAYAIWHLEDANDETLVELDEYLFGGSSREALDPANLPWESGTFRLFISHTSANAELAGKLRGYFAHWRIDAFVAHTTIEPTREWEREIEAALSSCHALTALVSDDFVTSRGAIRRSATAWLGASRSFPSGSGWIRTGSSRSSRRRVLSIRTRRLGSRTASSARSLARHAASVSS